MLTILAALAPPPAAAEEPAAWHGRLSETIHSSCSQSWDVSTYDSQIALELRPRGRAALRAETAYSGAISGWDDPEPYYSAHELRCAWSGAVRASSGELAIRLEAPEDASYTCEIPGASGFELRCAEGRRDVGGAQREVMVCGWSAEAPWLLARAPELILLPEPPGEAIQRIDSGDGLIVSIPAAPTSP